MQPSSAATQGNALLSPRVHHRLTLGPKHQQLSDSMHMLPGPNLILTSASGSSLCENVPGELGHGVLMTGADGEDSLFTVIYGRIFEGLRVNKAFSKQICGRSR